MKIENENIEWRVCEHPLNDLLKRKGKKQGKIMCVIKTLIKVLRTHALKANLLSDCEGGEKKMMKWNKIIMSTHE